MSETNGTAKGPTRKITRAFVLSDGKVIDASTLKRAERPLITKSDTSQEILAKGTKADKFVEPPFKLEELASLYRRSVTHFRAIRAKAEDSVGRGFTIVSKSGNGSETDRSNITEQLKQLAAPESFRSFLVKCGIDYEAVGNCYVEVIRKGKKIVHLNHVPAITMRVSKEMDVFRHQRGQAKTYFKRYGETRFLNKDTGEFADKGGLPAGDANEIYRLLKYDPNSDFYGIPDIVPALGAIMGDLSARDYNLDFFENGAVPAYAITIEGADIDGPVKEAIEDFFKYDLKGGGNQHRTVVIPIPAEVGANVKINFHPLNVEIKDGSFKLYRQENRNEILSAHGVPPGRAMYFTVGALGGDVSKEADKIYQTATVAPIQEEFATMINNFIADGFGKPDLKIDFTNSRFDDRQVLANFVPAAKSVLTVNELRETLSPLFEGGLDALDGGDVLYVDVSGTPTPLDELGTIEPPAPNPNGNPNDPTPPPNPEDPNDPNNQKGVQRHRVDYDDVDLENVEVMRREFNNVKDSNAQTAQRMQDDVANDATNDLIKVFDKMLRAAFSALGSQQKKNWQIWRRKSAPVKMNPVLAAIEDHRDDIKDALRDVYAKAMKTGARFSARLLGADLKVAGEKTESFANDEKAIYKIPDVAIEVSFNLRNPSVERFIDEESDAMSDNITKTFSNRIRKQMVKGVQAGESVEQIKERLEENVGVPGLRDAAGRLITAEVRAAMIARTETAKAFNEGSIEGYRSTGVVEDVDVIDGEDFDSACQNANGDTWSFRKAENNSTEHPNCTRIFVPNVRENPL